MNVHILLKLDAGDPLTPEEQAEWEAWQAQQRAEEEAGSRIGLVDVGEIMAEGVEEPDMLVADWLVKGGHHIFFGKYGSLKTWGALVCAAALIKFEQGVVWVDLEMGRRDIAERLLVLGLSPDEVSAHLTYLEYPSFTAAEEDRDVWAGLMQQLRPALVVWDAQTGALAAADVEENSGTGNAQWQRWYIEPVRKVEGTVIMIDHTGHDAEDRPVASRQKMAAAKVGLSFKVKKGEEPSREKTGFVTVECTKNNLAAPIPPLRRFRVGPDPDRGGRFVFEEVEASVADLLDANGSRHSASAKQAARDLETQAKIAQVVREWHVSGHEAEKRLTQRKLEQRVPGGSERVRRLAKDLALSGTTGVRQVILPDDRIEFFWDPSVEIAPAEAE